MRWLLPSLITILVLLSVGSIHAQVGIVEGVVIDSVSRVPISGATLRVGNLVTSSDRDGRFTFVKLSPGGYRLTAAKPGYVEKVRGIPIVIPSEAPAQRVVYEMVPAGVITGRAIDDEGRPMRGVLVQALSYISKDGRREMMPRGNPSVTNDRGEFRLYWLDPGDYYISLNLFSVSGPLTGDRLPPRGGYYPSNPDESFALTYYPGTADPNSAEPVRVTSGELDVHAVQMDSVTTRRIRGRIVNDELTNRPPFNLTATLAVEGEGSRGHLYRAQLNFGTEEFSIQPGVERGIYRLSILANKLTGEHYFGSVPVVIADGDPRFAEIPLVRGISLQGQIQMNAIPNSLSVTLTDDAARPMHAPSTVQVSSQGAFKVDNLFPGRYTIRMNGFLNSEYLSSPENVEIGTDMSPSTIDLIVKDGGQVRGHVDPNSTVVLVPEPALRSRLDFFKYAISDGAGEFEIKGVAPGSYTIFALEQIDPAVYEDIASLSMFVDRGAALTVTSVNQLRIDPPLIRNR